MKYLKEIKNGKLYYAGYCLKDLAEEFKTPLKITFLDVIKERVLELKQAFSKAIKDNDYQGDFIYLNANKANYGALEIETAYRYADGLETSSYYDLILTGDIFRREKDYQHHIVCNGYKPKEYIDEIEKVYKEGFKIIDIIDSLDEYEELKKRNLALEVGLRIHLPALYIDEKDVVKNDRFGLTKEEYFYILDDLKNSKMILSTIHFHQRGFDYEEEKFRLNFTKAFEEYYVTAAKRYKTVVNYNIGGGTPLPVSGNFDYYSWANEVIKLLKFLAKKNQVKEPNLLSENGKYSQKDATINLYKVVGVKNTDEYPWYIIDGSLMIAMPELFALGEPIRVCPVNNLDREIIKVRLAGLTCDCDDIYFDKEKGYFLAPRESKDLYIACLGTGSYQNSMSGKGGVHHCLLPEERDVVIYRKNGKSVKKIRSELQSISKIYRLMHFKK